MVKNPVPHPTSKILCPGRISAPFSIFRGPKNRYRNRLSMTAAIIRTNACPILVSKKASGFIISPDDSCETPHPFTLQNSQAFVFLDALFHFTERGRFVGTGHDLESIRFIPGLRDGHSHIEAYPILRARLSLHTTESRIEHGQYRDPRVFIQDFF